MKRLNDYSDVRHRGGCVYCGRIAASMSKDHVPSKVLLDLPLPANVHVVPACPNCNESFSKHEEYVAAFIGAAICGSTDPGLQTVQSAKRILSANAALRREIEATKRIVSDEGGASRLVWMPAIERVRVVVTKNARGHAQHELGISLQDDPTEIFIAPLETVDEDRLVDFLLVDHGPVWPEVGCRLMQRLYEQVDMAAGWIIVQPGVYVYTVVSDERIRVRSIIREYLLTEAIWQES